MRAGPAHAVLLGTGGAEDAAPASGSTRTERAGEDGAASGTVRPGSRPGSAGDAEPDAGPDRTAQDRPRPGVSAPGVSPRPG